MTKIAILPVGSVEQHGPHLPIDTDLRIAELIAKHVASSFDKDQAALLPSLPFSCSWEHKGPGTIALNTSTLSAIIHDIAASLKTWNTPMVFALINWHGGNSALGSIATEISAREHIPTVAIQTMKIAARIWGDNSTNEVHAGGLETAILQALWPDLVRDMDFKKLDYTPNLSPIEPQVALQALGAYGITPVGIWGSPSLAQAEKGHHVIFCTIDEVYKELKRLLELLGMHPGNEEKES